MPVRHKPIGKRKTWRVPRAHKTYSYKGESLTAIEWSTKIGIRPVSFYERLRKYNNPNRQEYDPWMCFERPPVGQHTYLGMTMTLREWSDSEYNVHSVPYKTLKYRVHSARKPLEEALQMPYQKHTPKTPGDVATYYGKPIPDATLHDLSAYPNELLIREVKRRAHMRNNSGFKRDIVISLPNDTLVSELKHRRDLGLLKPRGSA